MDSGYASFQSHNSMKPRSEIIQCLWLVHVNGISALEKGSLNNFILKHKSASESNANVDKDLKVLIILCD